FVVEPQGAANCIIGLPKELQLVDVRLNGRPAMLRRVADGKWRVALGSPAFPCLLDVSTRVVPAANEVSRQEVRRPTLLADSKLLPVELGLWSVHVSPGSARPTIAATAGVTAAEQALLRLERLLSIAEAATPLVIESATSDASDWF